MKSKHSATKVATMKMYLPEILNSTVAKVGGEMLEVTFTGHCKALSPHLCYPRAYGRKGLNLFPSIFLLIFRVHRMLSCSNLRSL